MLTQPDKFRIFTDGGSRGNPGPGASAFVVYASGQIFHEEGLYLGHCTNNHAEYSAVISALSWVKRNSSDHSNLSQVDFFLDSLLVVNQIKRIYQIKDLSLQRQFAEINNLVESLSHIKFSFTHIPRHQNSRADFLVNQTLDSHSL